MTNRLITEQSLYLKQHAHNPVDWYPWGDEAFEHAIKEQKPVLVSIGYAACHWCHVMERESFENKAIADFMNRYFVCIKVDREEYPEVDDFYMTAVQTLTGSGGWPLNVFVTPDKLPFYGGTYFPPSAMHGRPSWAQILQRMADIWQQRPEEVDRQAKQMLDYLHNAAQNTTTQQVENWTSEDVSLAIKNLMQQADSINGGFGRAPKFPNTMAIQFLLEYFRFEKDENAYQHALLSLDKMIDGGIYDQLAGGFSRYTVDDKWRVPHFEKMLYDNALLINVLCDAYKLSKNEKYASVIHQTIDFFISEMWEKEAGFYSAMDADSEGEEGKFYTWTPSELATHLAPFPQYVATYLGITDTPNWEQTNIFYRAVPTEILAENEGEEIDIIEQTIERAKKHLLKIRNQRIAPAIDDKILLSWNALFNTALCKSAEALGEEKYVEMAKNHMDWMLEKFDVFSVPKHVWKNEKARIEANLDDLAFVAQALIQLSMVKNDFSYLKRAEELCSKIIENYATESGDLFYFNSKEHQELPFRKAEIYDGVVPSSNAVMAHNLHLIGLLMGKSNWLDRSEEMVRKMKPSAIRYPSSFSYWNIIAQRIRNGYKQIIVTGESIANEEIIIKKKFWPECYYFFGKEENFVTMPFGKQVEKLTQVFICTKNACLPTLNQLPENIDFAIL